LWCDSIPVVCCSGHVIVVPCCLPHCLVLPGVWLCPLSSWSSPSHVFSLLALCPHPCCSACSPSPPSLSLFPSPSHCHWLLAAVAGADVVAVIVVVVVPSPLLVVIIVAFSSSLFVVVFSPSPSFIVLLPHPCLGLPSLSCVPLFIPHQCHHPLVPTFHPASSCSQQPMWVLC
jgi:hypothetical protein